METEKPEGTEPTPATPAPTPPTPGMVTVTATQDGNVSIGGQSVALTKGQEVEMTPEEAEQYANLGMVEVKGGGAESSLPGGPSVPRRR